MSSIKENIRSKTTWTRILYMLLFALIYSIAEVVILAVVVFQLVTSIFAGHANRYVSDFGQSLSTFVYQVTRFVTYASEDKPFPFSAWPRGAPEPEKPEGPELVGIEELREPPRPQHPVTTP